ncbi:unnamed protein product [Sphenostylis stenocarpa]|uniref:Uncharacterized protein n=1 Tax=Sphenostylis stenocarpa TaxID=92480 RepID=A0AA86RZD7_9FABA|nr:unnamed protein product [Sphenostylis stenocarpa]
MSERKEVASESNRGEEIETYPCIDFSLKSYVSCKEACPQSGFTLEETRKENGDGEKRRKCSVPGFPRMVNTDKRIAGKDGRNECSIACNNKINPVDKNYGP